MAIRKKLIVDAKLQYELIVKSLIFLAFTFALIAGALFVWERLQVKQGFLIRLPQNSHVAAWARQNNVGADSAEYLRQFIKMAKVYTFFELLWKPLIAVLFLNALVLVAANVYYSNRIAGPIYRLKNVLRKKLAGEEVEPVYFRKNDAFQELADLVNKVMAKDSQETDRR